MADRGFGGGEWNADGSLDGLRLNKAGISGLTYLEEVGNVEKSIPESWVGKHVDITTLSPFGDDSMSAEGSYTYFARLGICTDSPVLLKAVYERGILVESYGADIFHSWSMVLSIRPPDDT